MHYGPDRCFPRTLANRIRQHDSTRRIILACVTPEERLRSPRTRSATSRLADVLAGPRVARSGRDELCLTGRRFLPVAVCAVAATDPTVAEREERSSNHKAARVITAVEAEQVVAAGCPRAESRYRRPERSRCRLGAQLSETAAPVLRPITTDRPLEGPQSVTNGLLHVEGYRHKQESAGHEKASDCLQHPRCGRQTSEQRRDASKMVTAGSKISLWDSNEAQVNLNSDDKQRQIACATAVSPLIETCRTQLGELRMARSHTKLFSRPGPPPGYRTAGSTAHQITSASYTRIKQ